jgi:excisionase family DNA binding protein
MTQEKQPEILTMKEACTLLHCHPNTLRNWVAHGTLDCIRFGKRGDRRFRKDDLLKLLELQSQRKDQ